MKSSRPKSLRSGIDEREHHREAGEDRAGDEVGREDVVCQPGTMPTAKSKLTTVCTESTSGVARPARSRYAVS